EPQAVRAVSPVNIVTATDLVLYEEKRQEDAGTQRAKTGDVNSAVLPAREKRESRKITIQVRSFASSDETDSRQVHDRRGDDAPFLQSGIVISSMVCFRPQRNNRTTEWIFKQRPVIDVSREQ